MTLKKPHIHEQLENVNTIMGLLNNLSTVEKQSLVGAINEINIKSNNNSLAGSVNYTTWIYTATLDNTTSFSIVDNGIYEPSKDQIQLFYGNTMLIENENYTKSNLNISLGWGLSIGEQISMIIYKTSPAMDGDKVIDGTIAKEKLDTNLQDTITNAEKIGDLTTLNTSEKTNIVGAVSEVNSQLADMAKKLHDATHYGVVAGVGHDNTTILQSMIDNDLAIYLPKGDYYCTHLTIKTETIIIGENKTTTRLMALPSENTSFVSMSVGVNQGVNIQDICFYGNSSNTSQHGVYFRAEFPPIEEYQHGGLWHSNFKKISIENFSLNGLSLIGSGNNALLPIQGCVFENVWVTSPSVSTAIPFYVAGQVEQSIFNLCGFGGLDNSINSCSAKFERRRNADNSVDGDCGGGACTFTQCYFGSADTGIKFERTWNTTFIDTYFELVRRSIYLTTVCCGIKFIGGWLLKDSNYSYSVMEDGSNNELKLSAITSSSANNIIKVNNCTISNCDIQNDASCEISITGDGVATLSAQYGIVHFSAEIPYLKTINSPFDKVAILTIDNSITLNTNGNIYGDTTKTYIAPTMLYFQKINGKYVCLN